VFGGGEVWQQTFAALYSKVSYADEAVIQCDCTNVWFLWFVLSWLENVTSQVLGSSVIAAIFL